MLHDLSSPNCRLLIYRVGLSASRSYLPTCHESGAPRGQSIHEPFRNCKTRQDLGLFFSSGFNIRDEGGGDGECATGKEMQKGGG